MGVLYTIEANGVIGGWSTNGLTPSGPVYNGLEGGKFTLLLPDFISAVVTVTNGDGSQTSYPDKVQGGWRFTLNSDGQPTLDEEGGYVVTPPQPSASHPDSSMYSVIAMLKNGTLSLDDVTPEYINSANQALYAAGISLIPNTILIPLPMLTAVSNPL